MPTRPVSGPRDVTPFDAVLQTTNMPMATTNPLHFTDATTDQYVVESEVSEGNGQQLSGNSVELSSELMKEGMVKRDYDLNTAIVKSFHKMMLMTVRKG